MASNRLRRLTSDSLSALARTVRERLGANGAGYPVSPGAIDDLAATTDGFVLARAELMNARSAFHAAVRRHEAARLACAEAVATVANACYASPEVTPGMIARLGLSPRSTSHARHTPQTPERLLAQPSNTGEVVLSWSPGENADRMVYLIEVLSQGSWTFHATTQRTRLRLTGFPPGAEANFRVRATKNDQRSSPSNVATIYARSASKAA